MGRTQILGKWGEDQACLFLQRHGFRVVERNYFSPVGEIDVVATKAGDYYFIEVKTRAQGELATDLAVTPRKKHKLGKTIRRYCYERGVGDTGLILASLLVCIKRAVKKVSFRLAVIY